MRTCKIFSGECSENRKIEGLWRRLREQSNLQKPWSAGERNGSGKTQEDQYRQKLEDVFSGQEPMAKISEDVNSSALPVFQSAHDTESCQQNIKQKKKKKKMEGRRCRERSYMSSAMVMFSFFLISLQIDLRPENKDI